MSGGAPGPARLLAAMEATWRPARVAEAAGWRLRFDPRAGSRVSAATALVPEAPGDIGTAEAAMRAAGQRPLFRLGPDEDALDAALAARGYRVLDPTLVLLAPAATIAPHDPKGYATVRGETPLAVMRELWAGEGVGPARLAVMARSGPPRAYLLGRTNDRPAGCAFVAQDSGIAMLHALYTRPEARGRGVARALTGSAASWALECGAPWLALAVTEANAPARRLYEGLGMAEASRYRYRALPE